MQLSYRQQLEGGFVHSRTKNSDDEAIYDAEPARPPMAAVDLWLFHDQVNDRRHPKSRGALYTTSRISLSHTAFLIWQECQKCPGLHRGALMAGMTRYQRLTNANAPMKPCTAKKEFLSLANMTVKGRSRATSRSMAFKSATQSQDAESRYSVEREMPSDADKESHQQIPASTTICHT